jgi:hypothetical protein
MAVNNYQNPGVYVSQVTNPSLTTANPSSLNICFLANASGNNPIAPQTDRFLVTTVSSGQVFNLTQSGVQTSSLVVTNNTTGATLTSGVDYTVSTTNNVTSITTISGGSGLQGVGVNGWIAANYNYTTAVTGTTYTFYNFNSVQNTFGPAFSYAANGTVSVNSPATLAAWLAFQNGAQVVSCQNIVSATGNAGTEQDFLNAVQGLVKVPGINVIVPLKYDTTYNPGNSGSGTLFTGINNFLTAQANNGTYQRAFVGMDSTVSGTNLINTVFKIATSISPNNSTAISPSNPGTRMTLAVPQQININPGLNSVTGVSNGYVTVDGIYLAAALAGLFAGQPDVYVPITHKLVNGVQSIPNQIAASDSTTIQSFGGTVVRQRADGTIYVRHGLTLNTSNWLTQELSINAIGDRLSNNIANAISNSTLIGSPLTNSTMASLQSTVLATLMRAVNTNLIQSYQNLTYSINPANPTNVVVNFQYSPTIPLNYINVNLSVNVQTGTITSASNVGSTLIA